MKGLRGWAFYAVVIALGAAAALSTRSAAEDPAQPSIENAGPPGIRALYLYLKESGRAVREGSAPLTELPADARTVLVPAPHEREISEDEVAALKRFVEGGGTLVYLAARPLGRAQPRLEAWLGVDGGPALEATREGVPESADDPGGATATVWQPHGAASGLSRLRVSGDEGLGAMEGWAPVAGDAKGTAVAWRRFGRGEAWVLAGADLAENRRLELLDNLRFWEQLAARGPVVFDEFHHHAAAPPPMSRGILVFVAQLLACAAFFAYARGSRFGPPRPEPVERHRSSLEYLHSLAWLTRRAKVEKELLTELEARHRALLHERLGLAPTLPDAEVARALESSQELPAAEYLEAVAALKQVQASEPPTAREYLRASRALARVERRLTGRTVEP